MTKFKKVSHGIGLVEVIAALGISMIVLTALVSMTIFTLKTSTQSKYLLEGTKVASQQLELVRAYRDSCQPSNASCPSWTSFVTNVRNCYSGGGLTPCVMTGVTTPTTASATTPSVTTPTIVYFTAANLDGSYLSATPQSVRIYVTAQWLGGRSGANNIGSTRLYTDLTNWRAR